VIYAIRVYLIRKRCYRSENRVMPLWTLIGTEIYSGIARSSLGTVENHSKNSEKHGTLLWKSQKSQQNHSSLYSC